MIQEMDTWCNVLMDSLANQGENVEHVPVMAVFPDLCILIDT